MPIDKKEKELAIEELNTAYVLESFSQGLNNYEKYQDLSDNLKEDHNIALTFIQAVTNTALSNNRHAPYVKRIFDNQLPYKLKNNKNFITTAFRINNTIIELATINALKENDYELPLKLVNRSISNLYIMPDKLFADQNGVIKLLDFVTNNPDFDDKNKSRYEKRIINRAGKLGNYFAPNIKVDTSSSKSRSNLLHNLRPEKLLPRYASN